MEFPAELEAELGGRYGVWDVLPMGFTPSPYLANRTMARAMEIAKGAPDEPGNPFGFASVKLNLPMSEDFNPTLPFVLKLTTDGRPSGDALTYVDDGRVTARDNGHADACMRRICSRLEWLGVQDAKRKRRSVSQRAGAWAGGVIHTDKGVPRKFLSQKRWDKLQAGIKWLREHLHDNLGQPWGCCHAATRSNCFRND